MGEPVLVKPFTYTVLESRWRQQLGDDFTVQVPQHQFLLIRLSITNSGGQTTAAPLLSLIDSKGNVIQEHQNGGGLDGWFGLLRNIQPAQTEEGWIAFDASPNNYVLKCYGEVTDDSEQTGLVNIPLNMDTMNENPAIQMPEITAPGGR